MQLTRRYDDQDDLTENFSSLYPLEKSVYKYKISQIICVIIIINIIIEDTLLIILS